MIVRRVIKPVSEVAKKILEYEDSPNQLQIFDLIGYSKEGPSLTRKVSLDEPDSLGGDEFAVCYKRHTEYCVIKDPSDPGYLDSSAVIADINKDWAKPEQTQIKWRQEWFNDPAFKIGYDKLNELLASL